MITKLKKNSGGLNEDIFYESISFETKRSGALFKVLMDQ
jgi:hypothetical protein